MHVQVTVPSSPVFPARDLIQERCEHTSAVADQDHHQMPEYRLYLCGVLSHADLGWVWTARATRREWSRYGKIHAKCCGACRERAWSMVKGSPEPRSHGRRFSPDSVRFCIAALDESKSACFGPQAMHLWRIVHQQRRLATLLNDEGHSRLDVQRAFASFGFVLQGYEALRCAASASHQYTYR